MRLQHRSNLSNRKSPERARPRAQQRGELGVWRRTKRLAGLDIAAPEDGRAPADCRPLAKHRTGMTIMKTAPILLLLLLSASAVFAQSADDYFHGGAQFYISNNVAQAKQFATNGLKLFPNDVKLKKLYDLLNQQQQSQQNQQQQQQQQQDKDQQNQQQQKQNQQQKQQSQSKDQQNQPDQNQQKQDEQKQAEQKQAEQKQAEQKKQEEQQKKAQQEQQKAADKKDQPDKDQKDQNGQEKAVPGQMTPEEAKRLLDAQKDSEQLLQLKPKTKPNDPNRPLKDW